MFLDTLWCLKSHHLPAPSFSFSHRFNNLDLSFPLAWDLRYDMEAFINATQAQSGEQIEPAEANELIGAGNEIIKVLTGQFF